jgi:hypothetical protein
MPVATPALSDEALTEMLSLMKGADGVELKLTVPDSGQRSALEALGMDPLGAQVRLVYFFDTPDLALQSAGVVVRARRVAQKGDDSVVSCGPSFHRTRPRAAPSWPSVTSRPPAPRPPRPARRSGSSPSNCAPRPEAGRIMWRCSERPGDLPGAASPWHGASRCRRPQLGRSNGAWG